MTALRSPEGRAGVIVLTSCGAGTHRSVAVAELVWQELKSMGIHTMVKHLDRKRRAGQRITPSNTQQGKCAKYGNGEVAERNSDRIKSLSVCTCPGVCLRLLTYCVRTVYSISRYGILFVVVLYDI